MLGKDKLRVLIVDDEAHARRDLRRMLAPMGDIEIIGEATDGPEAVKAIKKQRPDLVLLDVQMPGFDGFQVLSKISSLGENPVVIFVTAYDEYAVKAFEVHAADYLLKPIEEERLERALERVRRIRAGTEAAPDISGLLGALRVSSKRLAVRRGESLVMVDVSDVLYATVEAGAVKIVSREIEGISTCRSLEELEREISSNRFVRVHKSYLANIDRIYEITPWFSGSFKLRMGGKEGPVIPLSRAQAKELRKILKW